MTGLRTLVCALLIAASPLVATIALAQDQKVLVTVNDQPITSFDVQQRMNLWKLLGDPQVRKDGARKGALNDLINDIAKIKEATKLGFAPTEKDVDTRLAEVAKGLKTDDKGLASKLKAQGISLPAMRQYLAAQLSFGRLLRGKYKVDLDASPAEVDRRLAGYKAEIDGKLRKVMSDPRMQAVTVYQLQEINFPIDGDITNELLQSRAIEANTYLQRFKGCNSVRAAASGIFNVRVGRKIDADGRQLPPQLRALLGKTKPGRAIGPMRSPSGLQILAFCGTRKISPPKPKADYPTRQQVEAVVINEKYVKVVEKYSSQFRKGLLIEYRDPTFAQ